MLNIFNVFLQKFFSSLLPNDCLFCRINPAHCGICMDCESELPWQKNCCPTCAEPMEETKLCGQCLTHPFAFDQVMTPFVYEGKIKMMITQLKFHERLSIANLLSALMLKSLSAQVNFIKPDLILPVPLHRKRIQERGFNQALEIAKPLARALEVPLARHLVCKKIATLPQMSQHAKSRQKNLHNAFMVQTQLNGKHVTIVDDVVTTGSTVNEMANVLKHAGASRITVLAVARTAK